LAGLTAGQLAALEVVRKPRAVSAVANTLGLSRPATSHIVAKLVQSRLVRRTEDTRDKRRRRVSLTPKGQALLDRVSQARAARFEQSLAVVPPRLARRFAAVLCEIVETLERKGDDV